jgi:hypothetical protein
VSARRERWDPYLTDPGMRGVPTCRCAQWVPAELDAGETRCLLCGLPSRRQVLRDQLAQALANVGAGGKLTPLRRLRFDPAWTVAEASGGRVSLARLLSPRPGEGSCLVCFRATRMGLISFPRPERRGPRRSEAPQSAVLCAEQA